MFSERYVRDRGGRIAERTEQIADQSHRFEYAYDAAGRLAEVRRDGTVQATYDYDANGNRVAETHAGQQPVTAQFDAQDRLVRHGAATYRYTSNGDLRERADGAGSTMYAYDAAGSLRTVDLPDGRHLRYLVDGLGRRVGREVDGVLDRGYLYGEGSRPSAELSADGAVRSRFVFVTSSNVPDYMVRGAKTYRIVSDHQGSPRLVVDIASGDVAQRIDYDAFGRVLADSNPGFQPFGYAGGLYDAATGLVRFGARDYDPRTGRWTTKDPIDFGGGDTNLYAYVLDDPVNLVDPGGASFEGFVTRLAGAYDGVTFGTTDRLRDFFGTNNVDKCSPDYKMSRAIGNVTGAVAVGTASGAGFTAWLSGLGVRWFAAGVGGGAYGGLTETMVRTGFDASLGQAAQGIGLGGLGGVTGSFVAGPQKLISEGTENGFGIGTSLALDGALSDAPALPACGC